MTQQVETLTIAGTVTQTGDAEVIVTAAGMPNSPKTFSIGVTSGNSAADVAQAVRIALAFNVDVSGMFQVSGAAEDVVLTRRIATTNDATLNISIDNDTSLGLTPITDSDDTTDGELEGNYYITLDYFKSSRGGFNAEDTGDDALILSKIVDAQKYIENKTRKVFLAGASYDRAFTVGRDTYGLELTFDIWTSSISEVTNGDGSTVAAADYVALPYLPPFYGIKLLGSAGLAWGGGDDPDNAIVVNGSWVYSDTPPADVVEAVYKLANYLYESKSSGADLDRQIVTAEGIILPAGVPKFVSDVIASYKPYV